jgi:hypothetical protein
MAKYSVFNLGGINNKVQPFMKQDGQVTRSINMFTDEIGAKRKRGGYVSFLDNPDNADVVSLFAFDPPDENIDYLYRASGSAVYYYDVGSGNGTAWILAGNGTITDGANVGHTVFDSTLIIGDGIGGTVKHTTNGTAFIDTPGAPASEYFTQGYGRIYAGGTVDLFWSTANDPTNWSSSGTSDSSSVRIAGAGKINGVYNIDDRIIVTKTGGSIKSWDEYILQTIPTEQAWSSPKSVVPIEGYYIGLNRLGFFGFDGGRPELISNPIEKQIYNVNRTGIENSQFDFSVAGINKYEYLCSVFDLVDGATGERIENPIIVYNYQTNEWYNYSLAHTPTAFGRYKSVAGEDRVIFGDGDGQVYRFQSNLTSDDGEPIEAILEGFIHLQKPYQSKIWKQIVAFANPGCQAKLQVAAADVFDREKLNWVDVGSLQSGVSDLRFSQRGRFLFYRLYEYSTDQSFQFYGFMVEADDIGD